MTASREDLGADSSEFLPTASIIVPAYNEQERIGPLLPVLSDAATRLNYLVIVACNGCTDQTVEMARMAPGVVVLESEVASKPRALNEAEREAGDVFPRLYVDADVRTTLETFQLLVHALDVTEARAVRPHAEYVMRGAPWLCRAYYTSRSTIPSHREWLAAHIEGHHIYGTNAAGRAKFKEFPEEGQIMEDAFFDRMFDANEKIAVDNASVLVPLPSSTRGLLRGMTRVIQGNWELTEWLRRHRPDRLSLVADVSTPARSMSDVIRHYARGGALFEDWRPKTVIVATSAMLAKVIANLNARRLVHLGRRADWR
jgi:glycosyltransferase involved in cell wall biosynthesis